MRIRNKVALVGGIPITVAAVIALVAWLLLDGAERARAGAVVAAEAARHLSDTVAAQDSFARVQPAERDGQLERFRAGVARAGALLRQLEAGDDADASRPDAAPIRAALDRYAAEMERLRDVTVGLDGAVRELNARTATLVILTDRVRIRQHVSNGDLIVSIREIDRRLRLARDVVIAGQDLRAAVLAARVQAGAAGEVSPLAAARLQGALGTLDALLRGSDRAALADSLRALAADALRPPGGTAAFDDAVERLIKVNGTEERALHDETAQLLGYAVQAAETEQATQNIAIETLELERLTTSAIADRDPDAVGRMLGESMVLARTMATLPMPPLIQSEMIDAMNQWRDRLGETGDRLRRQTDLGTAMAETARVLTAGARTLDESLAANADRIALLVRTILVIGTVAGLLAGAATAWAVARSITRPVRRLQDRMIDLAANPTGTLVAEAERRDELGAMARAANVFVTELSRRERDLRSAKERADAALAELRAAQASLIQAEKLASLGQLVAGVAHEINTPVGVALTTSTALQGEVEVLRGKLETGRIGRADMGRTMDRLSEGARLTAVNLNRAAELVYSFKQIAADQASGERRRIVLRSWLGELVTSLGPMLRRAGHEMEVVCPDDIVLDTHPGALVQVVTNLIANARDHAFPDGRSGRLSLAVTPLDADVVRLDFEDNGVGIPFEHRRKVFDPFYTTGRDRGSTGLGLHIVYNLVTGTLGGRITLDSASGAGTRVRIEMPRVAAPAPARDPVRSPAPRQEIEA